MRAENLESYPPSNLKIASTTPPRIKVKKGLKNRGPTVAPPTKNSWLRAWTEASPERFHQHNTSSEVDRVGSPDLWCRRQRPGQVTPGAWIPPGRQKVWCCWVGSVELSQWSDSSGMRIGGGCSAGSWWGGVEVGLRRGAQEFLKFYWGQKLACNLTDRPYSILVWRLHVNKRYLCWNVMYKWNVGVTFFIFCCSP